MIGCNGTQKLNYSLTILSIQLEMREAQRSNWLCPVSVFRHRRIVKYAAVQSD
jgi:hypothetical protein